MLPVAGLSDQPTVVPDGRFRTENWYVPEGATVTVAGLTPLDPVRVIVAVPRTACVEEFFAVTVIVVCEATVLGAV